MANQYVTQVLAYINQMLANEPIDVYEVSAVGDEGAVSITLKLYVTKETVQILQQSIKPLVANSQAQYMGNGLMGIQATPEILQRIHEKVEAQGPVEILPASAENLQRVINPSLIDEMIAEVTDDAEASFGGTFHAVNTDGNIVLTRDDGVMQIAMTEQELQHLTEQEQTIKGSDTVFVAPDELNLDLQERNVQPVIAREPQKKEPVVRTGQDELAQEIAEATAKRPKPIKADKVIGVQTLITERDVAEVMQYFGDE